MRKSMAYLAATIGILSLAATAHAGSTSFQLNPKNDITQGKWNVTLNTLDNVNWTIVVTGDLTSLPNADTRTMTLTFWDSNGSIVDGLYGSAFGGVNGVVDGSGKYVASGTNWTGYDNSSITFDRTVAGYGPSSSASNWLLVPAAFGNADPQGNSGGYYFTGNFSLSSSNAKTVSMNLEDTTRQWFTAGPAPGGRVPLVPEASSMALLLPALLPLGVVLRRRKSAKN